MIKHQPGAMIGIGGSDPVQHPLQTRPANPASTPQRDRPAGHEAHLTPLIHASLAAREPEPDGQLRADTLPAPVRGRAPAHRLMAMRRATAAKARTHRASAVHVTAAVGLESDEVPGPPRSRPHGQHQPVDMPPAARDAAHALPNGREVGR
jgi:hypothetical protein